MREKTIYRQLSDAEIALLEERGNSAGEWSSVGVADGFDPANLSNCRLDGTVLIGRGVRIRDSRIANFELAEGVTVESTLALECRAESSFGNGVRVAAVNECGGRSVTIFDGLTSQTAYISALYRYRPQTVERLVRLADDYAAAVRSPLGYVGRNTRICGAGFLREIRTGENVVIEGASVMENATIGDGTYVGADVKARNFITAADARIDNGVIIDRCFVGERVVLDRAFSAVDSLFFAHSHFENGEAVSVFAGPFTVSHHRSSLLIAGAFSFFNAGSGANQSNHLFKSGAVHQSVHMRGCKFASNAYVMSPAVEGPFTMIMGRHVKHHDTSEIPYSYLVERDGKSMLMPGASLLSCGTVRDIDKWMKRDRRTARRDTVDFDEYNPCIAGLLVRGLNVLNMLQEGDPEADVYTYNNVNIKAVMLKRGIRLYNRAIGAALGRMLGDIRVQASEEFTPEYDVTGVWDDVGGQYIARAAVRRILDDFDADPAADVATIDRRMKAFDSHYACYARLWALGLLRELLGHEPSEQEISDAVAAADNLHEAMRRAADEDLRSDGSPAMSVGYGVDCDSDDEKMLDYKMVRGLD